MTVFEVEMAQIIKLTDKYDRVIKDTLTRHDSDILRDVVEFITTGWFGLWYIWWWDFDF